MRRAPRIALSGACGLGLVAGGGVVLAPAAEAAACSGTSGVTVVVDTGSSVQTRCAPGDPGDAFTALQSAGFSTTRVARFPGALCKINGFPSKDPCVNMPPTSAYWAFFSAPAGGSWQYQQKGLGGYNPAPGTAVGFRFGSGAQPRVAPPAAAAPKPKPSSPRPTSRPEEPRGTSAPAPRSTAGTSRPGAPAPSSGSKGTSSGSSAGRGGGPAPDGSDAQTQNGSGTQAGSATSKTWSGSGTKGGSTSKDGGKIKKSSTSGTKARPSASSSAAAAASPTDDAGRARPISEDGGAPLAPALLGGGLVAGVAGAAVLAVRRRGH